MPEIQGGPSRVAELRRLPRGRHDLTRSQVEADQRARILWAVAEVMADRGYASGSVADVVRRAGVSRETYYRMFSDKLDGFLAAFDVAADVLVAEMADALDEAGEPVERLERTLTRYLDVIAANRPLARLFLVEANAAGSAAIDRRAAVQDRIVELVASELGLGHDGRTACRIVVAAVGALVVAPLVADDEDALAAVGPEVTGHVRRLHAAGMLSDRS